MNRFFVLTGGPGSGKTTLANALERNGLHVMPEAGRTVMTARQATGLPPRGDDPAHFADLMLALDLENFETARHLAGPVLFDRGMPDLIGYLRLMGYAVPTRLFEAAKRHRYNRRIFLAPHWPQIYATDSQRDQSPAEALETCLCIAAAYRELGYETVELPLCDVVTRAAFVQHVIAGAAPIR
ncbi:AAA family ATPase [Aliihoeflea aestuarii]|jgi:predicted ATPase|uniref:AAA family ATPase n=1 Tax=Aliihoeflea aestuarii TaxID=453840 RepID=UPI00209409EB|nr:AAA family ATPase [Aliihoeflea aestuarii]MCO6392276.1 AAA family ATPase [Aliihoeflea aestuarii]